MACWGARLLVIKKVIGRFDAELNTWETAPLPPLSLVQISA